MADRSVLASIRAGSFCAGLSRRMRVSSCFTIGWFNLLLLELPGIVLPGKRGYRRVFELYVEANLPFADAYHAVLMEQLNLTEIVTFDTDFDHIEGITRTQP